MKRDTVDALKASTTELQLLVEKAEEDKDNKVVVMGRSLKAICNALIEFEESLNLKNK